MKTIAQRKQKNLALEALKIAIVTILILAIISSGALYLFSYFFPKNLAQFAYDLKLFDVSAYLYKQAYEKDDHIDNLYNLVNVSILVGNYKDVETYYEQLESNLGYLNLVNEIDYKTENSNVNFVLKSNILNEDNYLKNSYIEALLKLEKFDKALDYAKLNFTYNEISFIKFGNYTFGKILTQNILVNENVFESVNDTYVLGKTLIEKVEDYFYLISNYFIDNVNAEENYTNLELSRIAYLRNRIEIVFGNLLTVNNVAETQLIDEAQIQTIHSQVKELYASLFA